MTNKNTKEKINKFNSWIEKCPIEYSYKDESFDDDTITINFYSKNISNQDKETN